MQWEIVHKLEFEVRLFFSSHKTDLNTQVVLKLDQLGELENLNKHVKIISTIRIIHVHKIMDIPIVTQE